MCLAVPLRIDEINGNDAVGSRDGIRRPVRLDFIKDPKPGDYVMVHAGFAIEKVDPEEAASKRALRDSLTVQAKRTRKNIAVAKAILEGVEAKRRVIAVEQSMMRGPARTERQKGVKQYEER